MAENAEKQTKRTQMHVRQDYYQAATRAGDLAYRIAMESEELAKVYEEMRALNQEGAKMQAEEVLAQSKKTGNAEQPAPTQEAPAQVQ